MKKVYISFIMVAILLSFMTLVEAATPNGTVVSVYGTNSQINYEVENKKREVATKDALSTLLEKYKTEEVPEDERITDYMWRGYGVREIEDELTEFNCTIYFSVTPYLEENTKWDESRQMCFAEFNRVDGELALKNISLTPEKYEEFIEAFEENERKKETIIEPTGIPSQSRLVVSGEAQIEKLTKLIFVGSAIILIIVITIVVIIKKNRK